MEKRTPLASSSSLHHRAPWALVAASFALVATACSGDADVSEPAGEDQDMGAQLSDDAGSHAPSQGSTPPGPLPSISDTPPPEPAAPLVCGDTALCLDVTPMKTGTQPVPGRLVVLWKQIRQNGPNQVPEVGFQMDFAGTESRIEIPLSQITPPAEQNLLCNRDCKDASACPCVSEPKVGTAFVLVYTDSNADGQITINYNAKQSDNVVAVGQVYVGYSDKAFKPPPAENFWRKVFPSGIELGMRPYSLVDQQYKYYQRFGADVPSGTSFPLLTCDAAKPKCNPKLPNPM